MLRQICSYISAYIYDSRCDHYTSDFDHDYSSDYAYVVDADDYGGGGGGEDGGGGGGGGDELGGL